MSDNSTLALPAPLPVLQARTAVGWEPEGVHLALWTRDSVLVSWQTGGTSVAGTGRA